MNTVALSASPSIGVVLNVFNRPETLLPQLEAVRGQSFPPTEILIWCNGDETDIPLEIDREAVVARCNRNLGVWSRFAFALNLQTDFVCILDDDTIPGRRWFENCMKTMETSEGLLGSRGLRFRSPNSYALAQEFGWTRPNSQPEKVDIVGHSWFFRRAWLNHFWATSPVYQESSRVGEDIHFAFVMGKSVGLPVIVPPHPVGQTEWWGSLPHIGMQTGADGRGVSSDPNSLPRFERTLAAYVEAGLSVRAGKSRWNAILLYLYRLMPKLTVRVVGKFNRMSQARAQRSRPGTDLTLEEGS